MGLTMGQRKGVTQELASRYRGATRVRRSQILDEFVELTRYNRNYAAWVLRNYGRKRVVKFWGEWVEVVVGGGRRQKVNRPRYYGEDVKRTLKELWKTFDYMGGQRLARVLIQRRAMIRAQACWHQMQGQIRPALADTIEQRRHPPAPGTHRVAHIDQLLCHGLSCLAPHICASFGMISLLNSAIERFAFSYAMSPK